jgi:tight adherence protein B
MGLFWLLLIASWLVAMVCWVAATKVLRASDRSRFRNRLAGGAAAKPKKEAARPDLLSKTNTDKGRIVLSVLERFRLQSRMHDWIEQAGLKWHAGRLMHGCMTLFLAAYAAWWYFAPPAWERLAVEAGAAAGSVPLVVVSRKRSRRLRRFEEQFPESLEFVSRSMRAGHAFSVSLEMLHREFQEPLAGEFRRTFDEHNLGMPLDLALEKLARRVPLMDVHFFVSAVTLQKRTGGNLAELLDKLAYLIRERFKLRGRIRAVSAHGRMTGMALSIIPLVVALMMFWVNREYATFFVADPTGIKMAACAVGLQVIGYGVIKKIVKIEA